MGRVGLQPGRERVPNSSAPTWTPWKLAINSAIPTVLFAATDGRGVQSFEIAPDLAVSIVGHSGTKPLGVQSFFDVKAQNAGPLAATSLQLSIALPTGTQNVSQLHPQATRPPLSTWMPPMTSQLSTSSPVSLRIRAVEVRAAGAAVYRLICSPASRCSRSGRRCGAITLCVLRRIEEFARNPVPYHSDEVCSVDFRVFATNYLRMAAGLRQSDSSLPCLLAALI
jgi:hypothetical protein